MSCKPEQITGYVDGALDEAARREVEAHLVDCPECREQARLEADLRRRLRELPKAELPEGLERRVRSRTRRSRRAGLLQWVLPVAATLLVLLWGRGAAPFVAWELARDHDHCFSGRALPAKIWSSDSRTVMSWFEEEGTILPLVPDTVEGLALVGARLCPLLSGTRAPHLYYASDQRRLSLFVVPHSVRFRDSYAVMARGKAVRLLHASGSVVGIVGEHPEDVEAFFRAFQKTVAWSQLVPDVR